MKSVHRVDILIIILASLISCFAGFANLYPFVFTDTGTYLNSGFSGFVPVDRSIFYGLFARHISLSTSPWLIIFTQGLLVCSIIHITIGIFFSGMKRNAVFMGTIVFLTLFTGFSYTVSILIPDIFSAIVLLCLINVWLNKNLSTGALIAIHVVLCISIAMHLSNVPILVLMFLFLGVLAMVTHFRKQTLFMRPMRLATSFGSFLIALLLVISVNYAYDGKARLSSGSHVFILNHLIETGILDQYLAESCNEKNYKICDYKESLGTNFVWAENSPLQKTGGWLVNKSEYESIIFEIVSTPKYWPVLAQKTIEYSVKQYFSFNTTLNPPQLEGSAPFGQIHWRFQDTVNEYRMSYQNRGLVDLHAHNLIQTTVILSSIVLLLFVLVYSDRLTWLPQELRWFIIFLLAHGILSAAVSANLSTVHPRFMNRIAWLLPLASIITIIRFGEEMFRKRARKN